MQKTLVLIGGVALAVSYAIWGIAGADPDNHSPKASLDSVPVLEAWDATRVEKSEESWRKLLSPEQFQVTRRKATERSFSGSYWNSYEPGIYRCVCCGLELFSSAHKFESGTGWPSFYQPIHQQNVKLLEDHSLSKPRTELKCPRCDAHLGHVFEDGPPPTGLRYSLNSAALKLTKTR